MPTKDFKKQLNCAQQTDFVATTISVSAPLYQFITQLVEANSIPQAALSLAHLLPVISTFQDYFKQTHSKMAHTSNNLITIAMMAMGCWCGGSVAVVETLSRMTTYWLLTTIAKYFAVTLAYLFYLKNPNDFNFNYAARTSAAAAAGASILSNHFYHAASQFIADRYSGVQRLSFQDIFQTENSTRTENFLKQNPQLVVRNDTFSVVDHQGSEILLQTNPDNTMGIAKRAQWYYQNEKTGLISYFYLSARGQLFIASSDQTAKPILRKLNIQTVKNSMESVLQVGFLCTAHAYGVIGTLPLAALVLLNQAYKTRADDSTLQAIQAQYSQYFNAYVNTQLANAQQTWQYNQLHSINWDDVSGMPVMPPQFDPTEALYQIQRSQPWQTFLNNCAQCNALSPDQLSRLGSNFQQNSIQQIQQMNTIAAWQQQEIPHETFSAVAAITDPIAFALERIPSPPTEMAGTTLAGIGLAFLFAAPDPGQLTLGTNAILSAAIGPDWYQQTASIRAQMVSGVPYSQEVIDQELAEISRPGMDAAVSQIFSNPGNIIDINQFYGTSAISNTQNPSTLVLQNQAVQSDASSSQQTVNTQNQVMMNLLLNSAQGQKEIEASLQKINSHIQAVKQAIYAQQKTITQKAQYQDALSDLTQGFKDASEIAMLFKDPKLAAKIQLIGSITINVVKILDVVATTTNLLSSAGSIIGGLGSIAQSISIFLPEIGAAISILSSLFGSSSNSADKAILQNQKIIIEYLQAISKEIAQLGEQIAQLGEQISREFQQLGQEMSQEFQQVLGMLNIMLNTIMYGIQTTQFIIQEESRTITGDINELRIQDFKATETKLQQTFTAAQAMSSVFARSNVSVSDSKILEKIQEQINQFYLQAAINSKLYPLTNGLTQIVSQPDSLQNPVTSVLANALGLLPYEASIQFLQNYFQPYTTTQLPKLANAKMVLEGMKEYVTAAFNFGANAIPYAKVQLTDMMQALIDNIQFSKTIAQSTSFFNTIFPSYNNALSQCANASEILNNSWITYATQQESFLEQYVSLPKQKLLSQINSFSFSPALMSHFFPGIGLSTAMSSIVSQNIMDVQGYLSSLISVVNNFSTQEVALQFFNSSATYSGSFPCIAINNDPLPNLPIDLTSLVYVPYEIIRGFVAGVLSVQFFYSINGLISADNPEPSFIVTGNYTLKNGKTVNFFQGSLSFTALMTNGYAGTFWDTLGLCNAYGGGDFKLSLCGYTPLFFGAGDCGSVVNDCSIMFTGASAVTHVGGPSYNNQILPQLMIAQGSNLVSYAQSYPTFPETYNEVGITFYNSILIKSWNDIYKASATPIQNTVDWSNTDQQYLQVLIQNQLNQISQAFFQTQIQNSAAPGYILNSMFDTIEAFRQLILAYTSIAFPNYYNGVHETQKTALCSFTNPWSSNSTNFTVKNGFAKFLAPTGSTTIMKTAYFAPLNQQEIRIIWEALENSPAQVGFQLGNKTAVNITIDPQHPVNRTYYTRINATLDHRFSVTTSHHHFDDQGGQVVNRHAVNKTNIADFIGAFVQNSQSGQQGIAIISATSQQHSTVVQPTESEWNAFNTHNATQFSNESATFFNVNISDPLGFTKLQTNRSIGVMNTKIIFMWKANASKHHNVTVGFDIGQQQGVERFTIGHDSHWKSNVWYSTEFTVTPETVIAITTDPKNNVLRQTTRNNVLITPFCQLAIRMEKSNAPEGMQSVTVKPVQVTGFKASLLPEPMNANQWMLGNSSQDIIRTPNGLTIVKLSGEEGRPTLTSNATFEWKHQEIFLQWKTEGNATVNINLAGETVYSFIPQHLKTQNHYARLVVFQNYTEITVAKINYDLDANATHIERIQAPGQIGKGPISFAINADLTQSMHFTLMGCTIQSAIGTIFYQMVQDGKLMGRSDVIQLALNASSPDDFTQALQAPIQLVNQFYEMVLALANTTNYPYEMDNRFAQAFQKIGMVFHMLVMSHINHTANNHNAQDLTLTESSTKTPSVTAGIFRPRHSTNTASHSTTNSINSITKTLPTPPPAAVISEEESQLKRIENLVEILLGISIGTTGILLVGAGMFAIRKYAAQKNSRHNTDGEELVRLGYSSI